ncbi:MAG: GntR family transcriptional regulator [Geminicoccaceae bacterium]
MDIRPSAGKLPFRPVARETVQDRVYREIREMILDGAIEPGRSVTIQSLADAFGTSAMPVREALHRLVAEKALTVVAGRSVGIPPLSAARLGDLRRVRQEIEGLATEWATPRITAADLARMAELIEVMEGASAARDAAAFVPANREFHFRIYRAAASETLLAMIESLWLQIGPYIDLMRTPEGLVVANSRHRAILQALRDGDAARARQAVGDDIGAAAAFLQPLLAGSSA